MSNKAIKKTIYLSVLGLFVLTAGLVFQRGIVRAARVQHAVAPAPYFPQGSPWTEDISAAPVDPQSAAMINWLTKAGGWGNHDRFQVDWSIRVLTADASTPKVPLRKIPTGPTIDSDYVPMVPLPKDGGVEGSANYHCNSSGEDCHLIVADRSAGKLYEFYGANFNGSELTAVGLTLWDLDRIYPPTGRGSQCSSADAAGLPIAPLLFNADELAAGSINHALRFILPPDRIQARAFVAPATHAIYSKGGELAPPMGAHLRLKASFDMSRLPPAGRIVARALQKYGMFLADQGNISMTAQSDLDTSTKFADVGFDSHSLFGLQPEDFEVVKMPYLMSWNGNCVRNK